MDFFEELEKLRLKHCKCEEDCWFSFPKSCDCYIDEHNKILDEIIEKIKYNNQKTQPEVNQRLLRIFY